MDTTTSRRALVGPGARRTPRRGGNTSAPTAAGPHHHHRARAANRGPTEWNAAVVRAALPRASGVGHAACAPGVRSGYFVERRWTATEVMP
jgi:hypothetical protein